MSFDLLAQASETITRIHDRQVVPVDFIWEQITALTWLQAVLALSFGMVYLLYGWRIFRILVVIAFGLMGLYLGILFGEHFLDGKTLWSGVLGLGLLAFVSVPLMKWCVCVLGATAGGIITGGIWYAMGLPQVYIWAGAAVGAVAGGMISFIVLKAAVMLFTSMGGSAIVVVSALSLLHRYGAVQTPPSTYIHDMVFQERWFLPAVLLLPTVIGIIAQNRLIKQSAKWDF